MGFYRSLRTASGKRALTDSIEIRFRKFSVFQPFVFTRRIKQDHVARPRRLIRLPVVMFVTAVCLVLSVSSIAIWMHTTSLVTQCTMDRPFKNANLVSFGIVLASHDFKFYVTATVVLNN